MPGELSGLWPEALGLMPPEFGRDVDRLCVLELARELDASDGEPPDAAAELADAVSALRLATAGAIAAGPVVFERLDFRPLRISPLLPIAATQPRGEAIRLDAVRARVAADLRERLPLADDDRELGEALDRWELSLFADEPFRSGQVRTRSPRCSARGDGAWAAAMRAAVLLQEKTKERVELAAELQARARAARPRGTRSAVRSSRRCCTAIAPGSSRRSTRRCSACGRGPASVRRRLDEPPCTNLSRSWHRHVTASALPSETWTKRSAVLERLERIRELERTASAGGRAARASCGSSSARRRTGRGSRATRAPGRRRLDARRRVIAARRRWCR